MGTIPNVLHRAAKPISITEFRDAVRAACPPRFPRAWGGIHRPVGLAISGGVDSMALAYLVYKLRHSDPAFKLSDNPISRLHGFIVDHRLRDNSTQEANAVSEWLGRRLHIYPDILTLDWSEALDEGQDPNTLPNLETVARKLRYIKLGYGCVSYRIASLLVAHHEDDQYETALMRLSSPAVSFKDLRGMSPAADIPECEGIFGAWGSGYIDDQYAQSPFYNTKPPKRVRVAFKARLRRRLRQMAVDGKDPGELALQIAGLSAEGGAGVEPEGPVEIEDGGVCIYRPLLEFSKDRLVATCVENNIPWWDDHTNEDPTLTLRNAIRHLYRGYTLPLALQKPSILALTKRANDMAEALEAEARRLLARTTIHRFVTVAGTATVQFPLYGGPSTRRDKKSALRSRTRVLRQREVAGVLIQKMIALVTPKMQRIPLSALQNVIPRLFPALGEPKTTVTSEPKAFVIAGVYFTPVRQPDVEGAKRGGGHGQPCWHLSRAPYEAHKPVPNLRGRYWATPVRGERVWHKRFRWGKWNKCSIWDGRYWIRFCHRLPYRVIVLPYYLRKHDEVFKEHVRVFREKLTPVGRKQLDSWLRYHAPGTARYTLPAIYLERPFDFESQMQASRVAGSDDTTSPDKPPDLEPFANEDFILPVQGTATPAEVEFPAPSARRKHIFHGRGSYIDSGLTVTRDVPPRVVYPPTDADTEHEMDTYLPPRGERRFQTPSPRDPIDVRHLQLLALPTLFTALPGVHAWLAYEARFRRVDRATLQEANRGRSPFVPPQVEKRRARKSTDVRGKRWVGLKRGAKGSREKGEIGDVDERTGPRDGVLGVYDTG
ncbi:hypothetical protein F4780DRAFT_763152 [Xylariomycetidae sp. FL0641]|nr:hypothetical protein F4780DRAFT_763152 [Xylariomycetidae sp. FL0641]